MKKFNQDIHNVMGSLPQSLLKHTAGVNPADVTARFQDAMTQIAQNFIKQISDGAKPEDIKLTSPDIFGLPVRLDYVASGTVGTVFKICIGDDVFALKINRVPGITKDFEAISLHRRARNLINRPYIGVKFDSNKDTYSWILSDYIADDKENSFNLAKEKLFYAAITKGLSYSDLWTPGNVKNGRIVDFDGLKRSVPGLSRVEIDIVKKFMHLMRTGDMDKFHNLAQRTVVKYPNVIKYIFIKMNIYQMEIPLRLQPFKREIARYNNIVRNHYKGRQ